MDSEPKKYEISYLISPDTKEEDVVGEAGKITGFIQDAKGLVGRIEEPKRRRLAYPIKKFYEAYFGWTRAAISPENVAELDKKLKQEKAIIRYLITAFEEEPLPARPPRMRPPLRAAPKPAPTEKPEEKVDIKELDKRLEEILGK